jgi:hypothetical protein
MFSKLLDALFGCWHSRYSFPMTIRVTSQRHGTAPRTGTYVVCLDCGKEFPYDWQKMKVVVPEPEVPARPLVNESSRSLVTKEAA